MQYRHYRHEAIHRSFQHATTNNPNYSPQCWRQSTYDLYSNTKSPHFIGAGPPSTASCLGLKLDPERSIKPQLRYSKSVSHLQNPYGQFRTPNRGLHILQGHVPATHSKLRILTLKPSPPLSSPSSPTSPAPSSAF